MDPTARQQECQDNAISSLNMAIDALNLAKEISSITPAKAVFGSASVVLTMVKDSMVNDADCVELGLACANVCAALDRGLDGKQLNELSNSVCEAINQLTTTVAGIQREIGKRRGRWPISRPFHAKGDKDTIASWRLDLNGILLTFNTELAINTHTTVSDIRHDLSKFLGGQVHPNALKLISIAHPPVSSRRTNLSTTSRTFRVHRTYLGFIARAGLLPHGI